MVDLLSEVRKFDPGQQTDVIGGSFLFVRARAFRFSNTFQASS